MEPNLFLKIYFVFNYGYLCMSVRVSMCECRCLRRADTLDSPGAGITRDYYYAAFALLRMSPGLCYECNNYIPSSCYSCNYVL